MQTHTPHCVNTVIFRTLASIRGSALIGLLLVLPQCAHVGSLEDAERAYKQRDFNTALNMWRPLAEQGNASAQTGLGILYDNGFAVPMDKAAAVVWLRRAADQGNSEAEYRLGEMYVAGTNGLSHDLTRGIALMTQSADQGNVRSIHQLGEFYRIGMYGVPRDFTRAVEWQRKGAELGYSLSMTRLVAAYLGGQGVPQDRSQAYYWSRRAFAKEQMDANAGDVVAELALAQDYEWGLRAITGIGEDRDLNKALYWYRLAEKDNGPLHPFAVDGVARVERELSAKAGGGGR